MKSGNLHSRMKKYENVSQSYLMRKTPVIIRLDGKAFHTFTRGFEKPFDPIFRTAMYKTMLNLCENIGGCVFGYTQSDEISLVLCDYQKQDTQPWFDYNLQKIVSVSAGLAAYHFSNLFEHELKKSNDMHRYEEAREHITVFDARAFNLPYDEVVNYMVWRQQDAVRNSIQSVAQAYFSHNELQGLSCNQLQDKLFTEKGVNWNDYDTLYKRGCCAVRRDFERSTPSGNIKYKNLWTVETEIPIFTQDKNYILNEITFDSGGENE